MAGAGGSERERSAEPASKRRGPGGRGRLRGAAPERLRPPPRGRWCRPARSRRGENGGGPARARRWGCARLAVCGRPLRVPARGGPPLPRVSPVGHVGLSAVCPQRLRPTVSHVPPPAVCPPWWCLVSAVLPSVESAQPDVSLCHQPCPPISRVPLSAMSPVSCAPHHHLPVCGVSAISGAPLSVTSPHQCCPPTPAVYPNSCPVSNTCSISHVPISHIPGEYCQDVLFALPREDAETLQISSALTDFIPASETAPRQGSRSLWAASVVLSAGAQEHPEDKNPEARTWHVFLSAIRSSLFWDPWYFPCSMHTQGALCCYRRQTHRHPGALYGQTWHRHSQGLQGVSLTSQHCHCLHVPSIAITCS